MQDRPSKTSAAMVRKQLLLTRAQNASLKAAAAAAARSEGDLVREAIDQWLAAQKADEDDWKKGLMSIAGMWADYPEIDQIMAESRERRRIRGESMNRRMRGEES